LLHGLKDKTSNIIALQEGLQILDAASDVTAIDAGEGVCSPGFPVELQNRGVFCSEDGCFGLWETVLVC
jgi:hypothetical protein